MKNKKLALLVSKVSEQRKADFLAEMKNAAQDDYEEILRKYGILLSEEEKAFLSSDSVITLNDRELAGVVGGEMVEEELGC